MKVFSALLSAKQSNNQRIGLVVTLFSKIPLYLIWRLPEEVQEKLMSFHETSKKYIQWGRLELSISFSYRAKKGEVY